MCFVCCLRTGETATWSHCQLFQLISICMLRWGIDIYRAAVGLINTTEGIIFLPICVRAPKDDTTATSEKQVSVKLGSECRTKYHSANKTAVVLSVISYKNKSTFHQWMFKIGQNRGFQVWRPWQVCIKPLTWTYKELNWAETCWLVLSNVWRPMHRVSLIGDLNGLIKLGVEDSSCSLEVDPRCLKTWCVSILPEGARS